MNISFLYPKFLIFLILVPFFVLVYFFSIAYNKKKAIVFANFEAMERFYDIEFFSKNFMALYANIIVLVLVIFSLAGTVVSFYADTSEFSYVIAIDSSSSMATEDVSPNRLEVAKTEAKKFVDLLPVGVEVGVISFSGDALVLLEPDNNKPKIKMAIDSIEFGEVQGTNVYNALISANKVLGVTRKKSVLLMSDGQLNVADAPQVIRYIGRNNLIVNTIAIGTEEGGVSLFNTVSKIDVDFLKSLAYNSNGEFFMTQNENDLGSHIESLVSETNKEIEIDVTFYFLISAILIFSIMWVLYNLRWKVLP